MASSTMNDPVPILKDSIEDLYPKDDLPSQRSRFSRLLGRFSEVYENSKPQFVARSPGRVNIIGEHIDYSLYEVLPMAIAADVLIAVCPLKETKVLISNVNSEEFKAGDFRLPVHGNIEIDASTLQWTNYFKAGFHGAVELLQKSNPMFSPCGMEVLVDGTVPAGGGLSSSAAFVCASALAVLCANGQHNVIKKELVELAIVSERSVGVNSGGMDQAASVFSIRGDAVSITFSPELHAEAIAFPKTEPPITFMIAQSFVAADKYLTAPQNYNLRVVECTLAAEVLAAKFEVQLKADAGPLGSSLRGLQTAFFDSPEKHGTLYEDQLKDMLSITEEHLSKMEGYTREEIASALSISLSELERRFMTKFPVRAEKFLLHQRAQHVFSEALRVLAFKELLQSPPPNPNTTLLPRLGKIMSETQASCRKVYDCSCPELDHLCNIAKEAGSYGGRLTGAGWGGCTVHLVPKEKVEAVRSAWEEEYYKKRDPTMNKEKMAKAAAVVVSEPGHGSMMSIYSISVRCTIRLTVNAVLIFRNTEPINKFLDEP